jgi:catechol-2,3-dioxygenase
MTDARPRADDAVRVSEIAHLELDVPDLDRAVDFYTEAWGLQPVEDNRSQGRVGLSTLGTSRPDLYLRHARDRDLRAIAFAAETRDDLDQLVHRIAATGASILEVSDGVRFTDPDGTQVELVVASASSSDARPSDRVRPRKLGHIVLHTGQLDAMEQFYALLGFSVTDRTWAGMSFLRCNSDHHTLALVRTGDTGLQHAAFDVGTGDDVMVALGQLRRRGLEPIWGPGRHGPGNNVFIYFEDPAGHIIEYFGDLQTFETSEPATEPTFWGPEHQGDRWGLAGPPPPQFHVGRARSRGDAGAPVAGAAPQDEEDN